MKDSALLSLTVGEDIPVKLSELAGDASSTGQFLTQLIRVLHKTQQSSSEMLQIEEFFAQVPMLIDRHKEYEATILSLRHHVHKLANNQAQLRSINDFLLAALPGMDLDRHLH